MSINIAENRVDFVPRSVICLKFKECILLLLFLALIPKLTAQITQVGTATSAYGAGVQSLTINKPTGVQVGDIMIMTAIKYIAGNADNTWVNDNAGGGWTVLASTGLAGNSNYRATVLYKVVSVDWEPTSYQVVPGVWYPYPEYFQVSIIAYTGIDKNNPFDVVGAITSPTATSGSTITLPSITTTTSNSLVVLLGMNYRSGTNTTPATYTWTAGYTETYDNGPGSKTSLGGARKAMVTPGNTGDATITLSNPNSYRAGIMFALKQDGTVVAGDDAWIGHVFTGTSFNTYKGYYNEPEIFTQGFGGDNVNFTVTSNSSTITTENFSVRYRMNSTRKGLYVVDLGSDDGSRLSVDGTEIFNIWFGQAYSSRPNVLMSLTGSSSLVYDFYEGGGANVVGFQNLRLLLANQLSQNTDQTVTIGSSGATISGDIYGSLPTGITKSGTGYQWYYSTSPSGTKVAISGATGATYTPTTTSAPFNTGGTYYLYRYAILSSANNVTPDPYVATNVSNAATLTVVNREITVSTPTLNWFTYAYDHGPSAEQTFTVSATGLTNDVTINSGIYYEISTTPGVGFTTSLTLPKQGVLLPATTIYVRLRAGLSVNSYNGQSITVSSTNVSSKTVTCNGTVTATLPVITASGGYDCATGSIRLYSTLTNIDSLLYWEGPNSFYSTAQNPVITSPTAANNGTYTVYGSVLSGINLLTNGNFESGNTGFTSAYTNNQTSLQAESTYAIVQNPNSVHSGFTNCGDHTTGSGYQMVINGATAPNVTIWSQTVNCTPNTYYQLTYWLQSVVSNSASRLQLFANGSSVGPVYTANLTLCSYKQYIYNWNSGTSTSVLLELKNMNTEGGGNDFAIDDIVFQSAYQVTSSVNVVVNSTVPSVSIVSSANNVPAGTAVSFTANPTNAGATPTYQWRVNGVNVPGETDKTFTYVPQNGDVVTCVITSSNTCSSPTTATSNALTMTVTVRSNFWLGSTSTDWANPLNWTDHVPLTNEDVVFASTASGYTSQAQRNLVLDANRTIGNLINLSTSGVRLEIPVEKMLEVSGNITMLNNNPELIHIKSSATLPNGSFIFYTSNPVYATVEMYSKASYNLLNPINQKYKWQYFGIPLKSIVPDPTLYGAYVRRMLEHGTTTNNHWEQLNNSSILTSFTGYEICQQAPVTYTFQGQLENSDKTLGAPFAVTSGALYPGQHLLANPYTAAIDVRKIEFGSAMEKTVYLYNTGTFTDWQTSADVYGDLPGQYIAIPQNVAGTGSIPSQVPSMSTMLVKALSSTANAYVKFSYGDVVVRNVDKQRAPSANKVASETSTTSAASVTSANVLLVAVQSQNTSDKMWLISNDACTDQFDNGYDGLKFEASASQSSIYSVTDDGAYQINSTGNIDNAKIFFRAGVDAEYTLRIKNYNLGEKYPILYLLDEQEKKLIDITSDSASYTFTANNSTGMQRFRIIARSADQAKVKVQNMFVYNDGNQVYVKNTSGVQSHINIFDVLGRLVYTGKAEADELISVGLEFQKSYIIQSATDANTDNVKVIIR